MAGHPLHVVFMNMAATGHMNPTLPLVRELRCQGCEVTYFVEDTMRGVVEAAGAAWRPFRYLDCESTGWQVRRIGAAGVAKYVPEGTPSQDYEDRTAGAAYDAESCLPGLLEDLAMLVPAPTVIVYDPFVLPAQVAAHVLGIHAIGLLTMPGPGVLIRPASLLEKQEALPWVDGPRTAISQRYGFDVFERGMAMEAYSPELNLVTTIEELFSPPASDLQIARFGQSPFVCIGPLVDKQVQRVGNAELSTKPFSPGAVASEAPAFLSAPLPWDRIDAAASEGRKIVFVSLGTVATSARFWSIQFGPFAASNGLADVTGREFCQYVWRMCCEVLGDADDFLVVMALGSMPEAWACLPQLPDNFIVRDAVPQLELLPRCSTFITHGGANSMHEGLHAGVPLVVVPIFGDQPTNGDTVQRCGAGVAFRSPLSTLTAKSLKDTISAICEDADSSSYRANAKRMSQKLRSAGGVKEAASSIMEKAGIRQAHLSVAVGGA